jgi:hypothetical protein
MVTLITILRLMAITLYQLQEISSRPMTGPWIFLSHLIRNFAGGANVKSNVPATRYVNEAIGGNYGSRLLTRAPQGANDFDSLVREPSLQL